MLGAIYPNTEPRRADGQGCRDKRIKPHLQPHCGCRALPRHSGRGEYEVAARRIGEKEIGYGATPRQNINGESVDRQRRAKE